VSDNFKDFQYFTNWHVRAAGYGIDGYALDKDILVKGNKVYHENRCVLVPHSLNTFLTARKALRGEYAIGVTRLRGRKFVAQVHIAGITKHLGVFTTESEAYEVYKGAKEAEARRWHERLKAGEFIVDERVIERMRTWTLEGE
jgi:hypothetical protein